MSKLVMAVHTMEAATATVPFAMILLLDHAKRRTMPDNLKVRMVLPSGGLISVSLWDVDDPEALKTWLDENIGQDCVSEVHEVQEQFTFGVALELARARAAEKMTSSGLKTIGALGERLNTAVESTTQRLGEWDKRTGVLSSAKEITSATVNKVAEVVAKAAEHEKVQTMVAGAQQAVNSGWQRVAAWMGGRPDYYGAPPPGGAAGAYHTSDLDFSRMDSLDRPLSSTGTDVGFTHPPSTLVTPAAPNPMTTTAAPAAAAAPGTTPAST